MALGKLGVWFFTDGKPADAAATFAQDVEKMGFSALWIPETVGRHPFVHAGWLLANTKTLNLATGIASIYNRDPGTTMSGAQSLAEQSGGRFVLGLGVSHQPLVENVRGHEYGKPVTTMRNYLARMKAAPFAAVPPAEPAPVVLAALGPKMLELAATEASGAHPYFTTPEHTKTARDIMGPDAMLCVEQKIILCNEPAKARDLARKTAGMYASLPNYRNNWFRLGFSENDVDTLSDEFIDGTFAWGTAADIRARVQAHLDAGASHVCVQPVHPDGVPGEPDFDALAAVVN